ncbi:heme biosynthesis protein HemY [Cellulomonas cellasea]|uniref:Heme biosynthesis protein HemY n=2 Tax=Cellulomonas cellasea TaxID=43670 RepID=A0A0A0B7E6_9CELL|nr:heme biosynthesis protein HemY [Cellulomonas cellasea]KGM02780.1 hypothetical protein Q760_11220 [Cellulomonas cellasea DSM 20118]GEA87644.1 hypothetical protein CCE01nite_15930 [Cellulomonas cellasea]
MHEPEAQPTAVDYTTLPERIALEDTIATQESQHAPDPTMGRDTETEFMVRNAG